MRYEISKAKTQLDPKWFLQNDQRDAQIPFYVSIFIFNSLHVSSLLPTCTRHDQQHRVTVTRGCIDNIFLSWWWSRYARNM